MTFIKLAARAVRGRFVFGLIWCACCCCSAARAQVAAGGNFRLEQAVVAAGGGTSASAQNSGAAYSLSGTIGQSTAGRRATAAPFSAVAGFWSAGQSTTAAAVSVAGRAVTATGNGIRNIRVTITDQSGNTRATLTGAFGYYQFDDVTAGGTYIFQAFGKRYVFAQPIQARSISEDTSDVDFVADK